PPLPADAEGNGPRGHADGNGWKAPAGELRRLERAGRSRERQDQGDGQPGARAGAQLDPPTVRLDDLARDREAEPERPGLRRHERVDDLVQPLRLDAGTVVPDLDDRIRAATPERDLDPAVVGPVRALAHRLTRVAD